MATTYRTWRPAESRLLAEWLATRWSDRRTITRVRVGKVHPSLVQPDMSEAEIAAAGVWRRWVDAVIIDPPTIRLVEASIAPNPGKVSQLELYVRLWPLTPEYSEYRDWPVVGLLVSAVEDGMVRTLAVERGLMYEVYTPPWVHEYLQSRMPRHRRAVLG